MNKTTENEYRELAIDLVNLAAKHGKYWLATSGFENADHCITRDDANGMGYWELVYVSIASNIDTYDVKF